MREVRPALARMQVVLIIIVLIVVAGLGAYTLKGQGSSGGGNNTIHVSITETDPVNQVDNFVPQNITVKQGDPVTLAVQNGDDEDRVFTISAFNFNITIAAHTTQTGTFTPDKVGTFTMHSPQTKPSAASAGKAGSPCTGYITVTA